MQTWEDEDDGGEFAAEIAKELRDSRRAGRAFARACAANDVDELHRAVAGIGDVVDGWLPAMRAVARLDAVGADIPAAFLPIWIEQKMLPLKVGDRRVLANALRHLMPRNYTGGDLTLYRGASGGERRRRVYGFSWTTKRDIAESFAEHWSRADSGGVLLRTEAPAAAILMMREDEDYYDESEVVVDPYALGRVTLIRRFLPTAR